MTDTEAARNHMTSAINRTNFATEGGVADLVTTAYLAAIAHERERAAQVAEHHRVCAGPDSSDFASYHNTVCVDVAAAIRKGPTEATQ